MVFSSLLFVFFFLVLNLLVYNLMPTVKKKNKVLLVFSLIFYSWGGPRYLLLLLTMTGCAWALALRISRSREKQKKKAYLTAACVIMLGMLGVFKYLTFFLGITNSLFGLPSSIPEIVLPIGISFYTFQLISYVADVYRGDVKAQEKYWKLLLYASLFHQCIAGPIVRYQIVADEIDHRTVKTYEMTRGIKRFASGLAKKAILANGCAAVADNLLPAELDQLQSVSAAGLWIGVLYYMMQIYLDFSAYSDMAIGMGLMVGFHYDENFNYPYIAKSVKDFWRRWHISLSSFFRDYVYIPLGGNRRGKARTILNLLVVWGLTGFWHGASWNYILWGLYFFVFLCVENEWLGKHLENLPDPVGHIYALIVVYFGWIIFRCESLTNLGCVLRGMFGCNGNGMIDNYAVLTFKNNLFLMVFCILACTPLARTCYESVKKLLVRKKKVPHLIFAYDAVMPVVMLLLSLLALVGDSYNPFLYFQF